MEQLEREFRDKERERIGREVQKAERRLRDFLNRAESSSSSKSRRKELAKFAELKKDLGGGKPEKLPDLEITESGAPISQWAAGDRVFLKSWRVEGEIIDIDRKTLRVNREGKILNVDINDAVHLATDKREPPKQTKALFVDDAGPPQAELKLLGFRVEDALLEVDQAIDRALRAGSPYLQIIHGHGSGALKSAVREYLQRHQARKWFSVHIAPSNDGQTELRFDADSEQQP
jgi:DNA mismatch repair protein MutS2